MRQNQNVRFDFIEFAYNRLVKNFQNYVLFGKTIPIREVYRLCGLLFRLNKHQTRAIIEDMTRRYDNVERNCQGVRILNQ
jgi:hypothetical protein